MIDRERTNSAMVDIMVRIQLYLRERGQLPNSLEILPNHPDSWKQNSTKDGWKRDIIYIKREKGFLLKSLGKDGRPGGVGANADLVEEIDQDFLEALNKLW